MYPSEQRHEYAMADGMQVAPLRQGPEAQGEMTTPPPVSTTGPGRGGPPAPGPAVPGVHPMGPTPIPWYPGRQ